MYKAEENIWNRVKEHLEIIENRNYNWIMIGLCGSQNYDLHHEFSDVDTNVILLPAFEDFCLNRKPISTTSILENNEHIDLKDIRLMFQCFRKQNLNFVELLFSKYMFVNIKYIPFFNPLIERREEIAHYNNYLTVNCLVGMGMEKYKALEHPYPGIIEQINKYGYDPKQLHHILRIEEFLKRYIKGESYENCLISKEKNYLVKVKKGLYDLSGARYFAEKTIASLKRIKEDYKTAVPLKVNKAVDDLLNEVLVNLIKFSFKEELETI